MDADQKWFVFLQSLPNREKDENGLPKGLGEPELYGPAGNKHVPLPASSFANINEASRSPAIERGPTSPASSNGSSQAGVYNTARGLQPLQKLSKGLNLRVYSRFYRFRGLRKLAEKGSCCD